MTKPIKKTGNTVWYPTKDVCLSDNQKQELLDIIGLDYISKKDFEDLPLEDQEIEKENYDRGYQVILNIETTISLHNHVKNDLDNPLNYSDYRDELEPLLKLISGLYKGIDATNPHVMNEIKENYPDFSMAALKKHLIELNKAAHDTLDKMSAKKETRGKKPKKALKTTVHALRKYFEKDCTLYSDDPAKLEQQQAIFIKTALQFANIPHPDNIKRLYYKEGETFTMLTQS